MQQQQQQVINWLSNNIWTVIVIGSLFIQIVPIKINPWTALFQWIGKTITGNACSKLDGVIKRITDIENSIKTITGSVATIHSNVQTIESNMKSMDEDMKTNEKDRIRWEILDFANSCHNIRRHTKDEFKHILELHKKYTQLVQETNDPNEVFTLEYNYIVQIYKKQLETNDFLPDDGGK